MPLHPSLDLAFHIPPYEEPENCRMHLCVRLRALERLVASERAHDVKHGSLTGKLTTVGQREKPFLLPYMVLFRLRRQTVAINGSTWKDTCTHVR